ncbi:MAG: alanine/ornithine racemase family PLP-dependent enzyme [Clostridiales bacterium]|jgi:predicted amino acid racemase|nr:alanine/ornithine racemase family PLP-dependent enzyme [Clostridiales bacterium]
MKKRPTLVVDHSALRENMSMVTGWCRDAGIDVAGVVKATTGMASVALDYESCGARWIASSRLEQLARVKDAGVKVPLLMIRVPMISELDEMVRICDYSLQSELDTLKALERAALSAGVTHNVILMADLGDLREGCFEKEELVDLAKYVEDRLDGIHLAGIGTNLGCVGSVKPTEEKMLMLADRAEAVEQAIGRPLEIVSGGATSSLMPLFDGVMPPKINMLRIGAIVFCGPNEDLFTCYGRQEVSEMRDDAFVLEAEVIETNTKPTHPIGELGVDAFGKKAVYTDRGRRRRAILAIGRADYGDIDDLIPQLEGSEVTMASGDHTILDIEDCKEILRVGDIVRFKLKYSAILRLTASENVTIEERN